MVLILKFDKEKLRGFTNSYHIEYFTISRGYNYDTPSYILDSKYYSDPSFHYWYSLFISTDSSFGIIDGIFIYIFNRKINNKLYSLKRRNRYYRKLEDMLYEDRFQYKALTLF